jgi:transposase-like protein
MAGVRRKYTRDYKEAAVALAGRADKTVGQAARDRTRPFFPHR